MAVVVLLRLIFRKIGLVGRGWWVRGGVAGGVSCCIGGGGGGEESGGQGSGVTNEPQFTTRLKKSSLNCVR